MHYFDIWTSDIHHAYLQSVDLLSRDILISKPVPKSELRYNQCLKLLKTLNDFFDSGDLRHKTLDEHHRKDLVITPFLSDPSLYKLMIRSSLIGLSEEYFDDLLRAGAPEFRKLASRTNDRFQMSEEEK